MGYGCFCYSCFWWGTWLSFSNAQKINGAPLFTASLAGVLATQAYTLSVGINFGAGEIIGIIVMPVAVAAFLVWYSKFAERKGWINT